jgi:rRNA processing protein Krr1/Pno1
MACQGDSFTLLLHQPLVYGNDVNLLGDNILVDTVKKNVETLIDDSKEVGKNQDIQIANRFFKNVAEFKCLGTIVTNQNLIEEELRGD